MDSTLTFAVINFLVLLSINKVTPQAVKCENGGVSNGVICICPDFTEGTICQTIKDIIELGRNFNVAMKLDLTVNYTYTSDLTDPSSEEYRKFTKMYDEMLQLLFQGHNGDITISVSNVISSTNNGEVRVRSEVTWTLQYNDTRSVLEQYEENYSDVRAAIVNKCKSPALCIISSSTEAIRPLTEHERCGEKISPVFMKFFDPVVTVGGLACMSNCMGSSPNFLDCNSGSCQIKDEEGPQCFCPRTDLYIYTNSKCEGAILIAAMYGGVGAAIGVLVIVGVILGIFLYRKKYYY